MGFYITKLKDTKLGEYIGTQTMCSCADNGAFNTEVNTDLEAYADENENVIAIVDKSGVSAFLDVLKSGRCNGRDVEKFINIVEEKYMDGFMIC